MLNFFPLFVFCNGFEGNFALIKLVILPHFGVYKKSFIEQNCNLIGFFLFFWFKFFWLTFVGGWVGGADSL
jgi:hypothetical protein